MIRRLLLRWLAGPEPTKTAFRRVPGSSVKDPLDLRYSVATRMRDGLKRDEVQAMFTAWEDDFKQRLGMLLDAKKTPENMPAVYQLIGGLKALNEVLEFPLAVEKEIRLLRAASQNPAREG